MNFISFLQNNFPYDQPLSQLQSWIQTLLIAHHSQKWWSSHVHYTTEKYYRIILYRNNFVEFVLICWLPFQSTTIHNHPSGGCLYTVLSGELSEEIYPPHQTQSIPHVLLPLHTKYLDDHYGRHQVSNKNTHPALSFHIYSPPFSKIP